MKIAVCLHLFYPDMFDTIVSYLNNLNHQFKLYVTLTNGFYSQSDVQKIKNYNSDTKIIIVENKGVDIGAFFQTIKEIDVDTDLILKLHTKKGIGLPENPSLLSRELGIERCKNNNIEWFNNLMKGVLSDKVKVNKILDRFLKDKNCGMVGFKLYNSFQKNKQEILNLNPLFGLDESYLAKNFVGGTIFWVRYSIIKKYFTPDVIDKILSITNFGYVHEPSTMHAVERIFGYLVYKENQSILVI